MLMKFKTFFFISMLVTLITGITFACGVNESDLVSWENYYNRKQILEAANWGTHVLMTETSEAIVEVLICCC